jgi:hypothetical protein
MVIIPFTVFRRYSLWIDGIIDREQGFGPLPKTCPRDRLVILEHGQANYLPLTGNFGVPAALVSCQVTNQSDSLTCEGVA